MKAVLHTVILLAVSSAAAAWKPPSQPNPEVILDEADADAHAGRNEDALSKYLWFHEHALEHQPSLRGVRLTTALRSWRALGEKYPAALDALRKTRDSSTQRVLTETDEKEVISRFRDVEAINNVLGEDKHTVALFSRLDKESPRKARIVYYTAQPSLIQARKYSLCGKYLNPDDAYAKLLLRRKWQIEYADNLRSQADRGPAQVAAEEMFLVDGTTLVALLVLNEKSAKANAITQRLLKDSTISDREQKVKAALKGKLPGQQPKTE